MRARPPRTPSDDIVETAGSDTELGISASRVTGFCVAVVWFAVIAGCLPSRLCVRLGGRAFGYAAGTRRRPGPLGVRGAELRSCGAACVSQRATAWLAGS